ncbi:hypothetical protein [Bacillus cereus]|uniref:hypothetical protein n=1 Tax=Bacillus cereus TaxID=1396 RepID=UPI00129085CC|nr:hypothetical protein [Bacillus cereus]HDR8335957.1 hypothetical protein [Bacillus cereus]
MKLFNSTNLFEIIVLIVIGLFIAAVTVVIPNEPFSSSICLILFAFCLIFSLFTTIMIVKKAVIETPLSFLKRLPILSLIIFIIFTLMINLISKIYFHTSMF